MRRGLGQHVVRAGNGLTKAWVANEERRAQLFLAGGGRREDGKVVGKVGLLLLVKPPKVVYTVRRVKVSERGIAREGLGLLGVQEVVATRVEGGEFRCPGELLA